MCVCVCVWGGGGGGGPPPPAIAHLKKSMKMTFANALNNGTKPIDNTGSFYASNSPPNPNKETYYLATITLHRPMHYEGWMISGQDTILCWGSSSLANLHDD
jgi:hypothetical protein